MIAMDIYLTVDMFNFLFKYNDNILYSGVPRGVLRVLEHPHQLWHNSQFSS